MAKLDDIRIKEWLRKYQNNEDVYPLIAEHLADFVYNYPSVRHQQDEEVCSEFFIYFFERLPKLLNKYEIQDCEFASWFVIVLRSHYLNWVKKSNKINQKHYSLEDYHSLSDHRSLDKTDTFEGQQIQNVIKELPKKVELAMKLHYFDFFEAHDLYEIAKVFKRDLRKLIEKYDDVISEIALEKEKQQNFIDKINREYSFINEIQDRINSNKEGIDELKNKLEYHQNRHQKYIKRYRKFYISLSYKTMSSLLGINENAAYNLVFRGKVLLKTKFEELYRVR